MVPTILNGEMKCPSAVFGVLIAFAVPGVALIVGVLVSLLSRRTRGKIFKTANAIFHHQGKLQGPPEEGEPLTVVSTDIEGSTRLWDLYPLAMNKDLALHDKLIRETMEIFFGYELLTEGDSFKLAFHRPQQAIQFCVYVQEKLMEQPWSEGICKCMDDGDDNFRGLRIRMGVHSAVALNANRHSSTVRFSHLVHR